MNTNPKFINFSNHPSEQWSNEQKKAAEKYGKIIDIPFPAVPSDATEGEVALMADEYFEMIMSYDASCVMCMGEFTLSFALFKKLKAFGIKIVIACSERNVTEYMDKDGQIHKDIVFNFVQFREIL